MPQVDDVKTSWPDRQPGVRPITAAFAPSYLHISNARTAQTTATGSGPIAGRSAQLTRLVLMGGELAAGLTAMAVLQSWSWLAWIHLGVTLIILIASDSHRPRPQMNLLEDLPELLAKLSAPSLVAVATALYLGQPASMLIQACLLPVAVVVGRVTASLLIRRLRVAGRLLEPVVVLGAGSVGVEIIRQLQRHTEHGLAPIGYLDDEAVELDVPYLGKPEDLEMFLSTCAVSRVIVAFCSRPERELVDLLRRATRLGADISIVPRFFDIGLRHGTSPDDIWGIPLCSAGRDPRRVATWPFKRALDVVLAAIVLLASAPLLGIAALAVRLTSPGPVIFRQGRIGQEGREFDIFKLRSLRFDAVSSPDCPNSRLPFTPVGRLLRRTKVDELPQLWNVIRGDMSLVGPRPEQTHIADIFSRTIPGYAARHRLPVGLTGLAQVNGLCGDLSLHSIQDRARYDNRYIEHWSLWRDIALLLRTLPAILSKGSS